MEPKKSDKSIISGNIESKKTIQDGDKIKIEETWTIPRFPQLLNNDAINVIYCPKLTDTQCAECKFQLKIDIDRYQSSHSQMMILISYMSPTKVFLSSVQLIAYGKDYITRFDKPEPFVVLSAVVKANEWQNLKKLWSDYEIISQLSSSESFCLHFDFVVHIEKPIIGKQFQVPETQLIRDLENLFLEGLHSDVVMKSVDGEEFRVHKAVLANRCGVLKAHFEHNTTESITNIVDSPLQSAILCELLLFIYTDKAPKIDEIPEKLLAAADYYQLSRLKSLCEEALHKKLTVDNAIETLQLADLHSANQLQQFTLEFIKQDFRQSKLITKTDGWIKLQSVDLLKKMYE